MRWVAPIVAHSNFSIKLSFCAWVLSSLTTLADDSAVAKKDGVDTIRKTDALVAFWDFQAEADQDRVSAELRLKERGGKIQRVDDGVWGPYAARLNRGQWFEIAGVWGEPRKKRQFCRTYSSGATDILLNQWHCIAMRYDGQSSTVFVDGQLDTWTLRNPFPYDEVFYDGGTDGESFTVGAVHRNNEWGNFYGGLIGGLAVFDRAPSDAELQVIADLAKDEPPK